MSEGNCSCRDCERLRSNRERCREKCYCRDCERSRERLCESERERSREKPKEPTCSNVIIQKYAPDCEKSSCNDSIKTIKIQNENIIYITIR
jgi:hypothetical protein